MHALDVLGDPVRRRILEILAEGEHASGEVVEIIGKEFGITQSAVSQQLKTLRDSGFATVRADGTRRLYALGGQALADVDAWFDQFRRSWAPRLEALETEIARGKRARRMRPQAEPVGHDESGGIRQASGRTGGGERRVARRRGR